MMGGQTKQQFDVLIVGAGHAGAQAAIALRQLKFAGSIGIIGDELELPYDRPPLSKDYLSGHKDFERLLLRPREFWGVNDVRMVLGKRVTALSPVERQVSCSDGASYGYQNLVWATGGSPRRLACERDHVKGVFALRNHHDADRIRVAMEAAQRVIVVGGGYIGLETAAALVAAGKRVRLLEAQDRVLARVAGETISRFYEAEHRARGVDIRLRTSVQGINTQSDGRVSSVILSADTAVNCDMVIVGIGVSPNVQAMLDAGAVGGPGGVEVDDQCRTSLPNIFAVGDCTAHANRYSSAPLTRLESVQNANDQATVAAKALCGESVVYDSVPWFWSHQYDLKLQTVGISAGHDREILRGDPASRSFSVVYLREGRVIALDCVNAPKDYVQGKRLVKERRQIDPLLLSDDRLPIKEMN